MPADVPPGHSLLSASFTLADFFGHAFKTKRKQEMPYKGLKHEA